MLLMDFWLIFSTHFSQSYITSERDKFTDKEFVNFIILVTGFQSA